MAAASKTPESQLQLVGYQRDFVFCGASLNRSLEEWEDQLFMRVCGGRDGMKSAGGVLRDGLYIRTWPGCVGCVTAPTEDKLDDTTIPSLKWGLEQWGLIEGKHFFHNINRRFIDVEYGNEAPCKIWLRSTKNPNAGRGPNLAFCHMDEIHDTPFEAFSSFIPALRQEGYPHQYWATSTPKGKRHWGYQIFRAEQARKEGYRDYEMKSDPDHPFRGRFINFSAPTLDNPWSGEKKYSELVMIHGKDSAMLRQEAWGEDVLTEGLQYEGWHPEKHLVLPALWPVKRGGKRYFAGMDFGTNNPCAILVLGVDYDGRLYLAEEFKQAGLSPRTVSPILQRLVKKWNIEYVFPDPTGIAWIMDLLADGLPMYTPAVAGGMNRRGSESDIASGIGLCAWALSDRLKDGTQRLYVDPALVEFRAEIENYTKAVGTAKNDPSERPPKLADHLMDCWRYLMACLEYLQVLDGARLERGAHVSRPKQAVLSGR